MSDLRVVLAAALLVVSAGALSLSISTVPAGAPALPMPAEPSQLPPADVPVVLTNATPRAVGTPDLRQPSVVLVPSGTPGPSPRVAVVTPLEPPPTRVRLVTRTPDPPRTPQPAQAAPALPAAGPRPAWMTCDNPRGKVISERTPPRMIAISLQVSVYVPPCYDPATYAYPVLYLVPGNESLFGMWERVGVPAVMDRLISTGRLAPFIVAMTDNDVGLGASSIYNWSSGGPASFEGYLINELMPFVEGRYSILRSRETRAIGGISRGGYWSLQLAFAHPELFGAVGGHSPVISSDYLEGVADDFTMLDQARSVSALRNVRITLDAGDKDYAAHGIYELSTALAKNGIPHNVTTSSGGHTYAYWSAHVSDYLAFYGRPWPATPTLR